MGEEAQRCPRCGATLRAHGEAPPVCEACDATLTMSSLAAEAAAAAWPDPETIGPYRVIRRLGEGGMGVVYLAQQSGEIERQVAIKVVKRVGTSKRVLARFQLERQSLALMKHPCIARIFDAGSTLDGQPYFAMEYVEGSPITTYCDSARMTNVERIRLFQAVCGAVQHAHQKGIIHRDLKPSNILVEETDDGPRPKVIDFGLAKATDQRFMEWSGFTEVGRLVGTPEYMSPEQAGDSEDDLDTRTDVYSLGAILYELLVGATPIETSELRKSGLQSLLDIIRDSPVTIPSGKLVSLNEGREAAARNRRTEWPELVSQLRGDLDWIVMRALEREKDDRYRSPAALAADLQRYLDDRPVEAGPPTLSYRLKKFTRRHRTAVAAAMGGLALLVVALITTTMLWRTASRERAQVLRLADMKRLDDYVLEAADLWPAHPDHIEAMERWLEDRGGPLAARLPSHRDALETLRATARPYGEEQRQQDRRTHPRAQELIDEHEYLEERKASLARAKSRPDQPDYEEIVEHYEEQIEEATAHIAELEQAVTERHTWTFDNEETEWQHQMLADLVLRLEEFIDPDPFVGTMASVRQRLEHARTVAERTVTGVEESRAWRRAIESIAASPVYAGLDLSPQLGLIPLDHNPRTGLWEFWHPESGDRPLPSPEPDAANRWIVGDSTGMVFVLVPGGTFWMGAQADDPSARNYDPLASRRENRIMQVTLDAFFMSKYETTQGQWILFTGKNPSRHAIGGLITRQETTANHPVEMVNWHDANETLIKRGLSLPTESQWEYAARAGTTTPWWTGESRETLRGAVNIQDLFLKNNGGRPTWRYEEWLDDGHGIHAEVGSLRANPFGLHNMLGNVSEWCRDYYRSPYHQKVDPGDGYRKIPGGTASRISRGGGWDKSVQLTRSAYRANTRPDTVNQSIGVRAVRKID